MHYFGVRLEQEVELTAESYSPLRRSAHRILARVRRVTCDSLTPLIKVLTYSVVIRELTVVVKYSIISFKGSMRVNGDKTILGN